MAKFFSPNIDRTGRIVRLVFGLILLFAGVAACFWILWAGGVLLAASAFAFIEAARGWCVMRACGVKTKY